MRIVRDRRSCTDVADKTDSIMGPDVDRGGGSGMAKQDERVGNQRLPAPNTPAPAPEHGGGGTCECGGCGYQGRRLLTVPAALHSVERGPPIHNRGEQEDGTQRPSDMIAPESITGDNMGGGDARDIGQSKTPRGGFGIPDTLNYSPH